MKGRPKRGEAKAEWNAPGRGTPAFSALALVFA